MYDSRRKELRQFYKKKKKKKLFTSITLQLTQSMFNTLVSISHVHFIIVDAAHFDFPREKILHLLLHLACSERLNNIYRICPATKSISLFFFFFLLYEIGRREIPIFFLSFATTSSRFPHGRLFITKWRSAIWNFVSQKYRLGEKLEKLRLRFPSKILYKRSI